MTITLDELKVRDTEGSKNEGKQSSEKALDGVVMVARQSHHEGKN